MVFEAFVKIKSFLDHEAIDMILLQSNDCVKEIYRCFICVCVPPNLIAATSLYRSLVCLEFDLSGFKFLFDYKVNGIEARDFPFNELFGASLSDVLNLSQFIDQFKEIIK